MQYILSDENVVFMDFLAVKVDGSVVKSGICEEVFLRRIQRLQTFKIPTDVIYTLSKENGDGARCNQLRFCLRKKRRINSVRVNCVHDLFEVFEASKYSNNFPSVAQC